MHSIGERYALSIDLTRKNPEKMVVVTLFRVPRYLSLSHHHDNRTCEVDHPAWGFEASSDAGAMRILTDTSEEGGEWFEIYNHATRRVNVDHFSAEAREEPERARAESRDLWAWIGIGALVGCSTLGWRMRRRKR